MQIEHLDNHTARLTVDVPQERFTAAMQRAAKRISTKVNIPGFRKGKAPFAVIVNYVGQQAVMDEAIEDLGNEIYRESLQAADLQPYTTGSLEEIKTEPTLQLIFSVPKAPEVDLGDYRQVRHEYTPPTITDEQVQQAIEELRERHAEETLVERPAEMGDVLTVDIHGEVIRPRAQEPAQAEAAEDHVEAFIDETDFDILLSTDPKREFMPNFTEQALGVSVGETRTVTLTYPEDYENARMAGHTFNITFTVKRIAARKLPELDDAFAQLASDKAAQTLAELTERVRHELEVKAKRETDEAYSDIIFQKIVAGASIRYPEAMVEDYIDDILGEVSEYLRQRGVSLEMLKQMEGKDDAALRADYREAAINRLKRNLVMQKLIEAEQITVSAAELDAHIEKMLDSIGGVDAAQAQTFSRMFKAEANRRDVGLRLVVERLKERLVAIGRGEAPALSAADLSIPVAAEQISLSGVLAQEEHAEPSELSEQPKADPNTDENA
ncbi:MAG: trigger factor [Aggregatilineales bacterium]